MFTFLGSQTARGVLKKIAACSRSLESKTRLKEMGKCIFNATWLNKPDYCDWIKKGVDKHKAFCRRCSKEIDLSRMGESALRSHMKSKKHKDFISHYKVSNIKDYQTTNTEPSIPVTSSNPSTSQEVVSVPISEASSSLLNFNPDSAYAEIRWILKCVESNYSFNSCQNIVDLFRDMFSDSEIAKTFSCGANKATYYLCFGLAPYFKSRVYETVKASADFCLMFDESLNNSLQTKQLDILVRFWDDDKIVTRYIDSNFLGLRNLGFFLSFLNSVAGDSIEFRDFCPETQRLDLFFLQHSIEKYSLICPIIKKLLLLSHGQATVERGFSVNRQVEVENLKEETYIAKRLVKDALSCSGGAKGITITKEMKISVRGARQKYRSHLDLKAKEKELKEKKRKNCDKELQELRSKKVCLEKTVAELSKSADSLLEKAEVTENMLFVKQANSFRRTVKEKQSEIDSINTKINELKRVK